jgi:glyoxylase-like metal-dependent hydrolase (beta-lactamase superfamily II)
MNDSGVGLGKNAGISSATIRPLPGHEPHLIEVTDRIWVAHGYSLSNIIYVVTSCSVVAIDSGESILAAEMSLADLRRRCGPLPVAYVIYTHSHADHIRGTSAMCSAATHIIAHSAMPDELARIRMLLPYRTRVDRLQFGLDLEESERGASHAARGKSGYVPPDTLFDSQHHFEEGGVRFELYHAPGESIDHVMVHLPHEQAVFPGDNFYSSFPMLSNPMKPDRPVLEWANSIDRMRALLPQHLIPSHGLPMSGADEIRETLTNYAAAIRYVHERTVDLINRGYSLEQVRRRVRLPPDWRSFEYLQPRYGSVDWAVCGIYRQYAGWYDMNPTHLDPAPRLSLRRAIVHSSGGVKPLVKRAGRMAAAGRDRLCLELTDIVLGVRPRHGRALKLRTEAMERLGQRATNRVEKNLYRGGAVAVQQQSAAAASETARPPWRRGRRRCKPPVFILAAPRSFTSVICAMLGRHPQMYGMPELHLFKCATLAEWFDLCRKQPFPRAHGLLRAVAQLYFGEQTERTVLLARRWLVERMHLRTGQVLRALGEKIYPATAVEKSPSISYDDEALRRAYRMFPRARFLHLVRHPKGQGASVMNYIKVRERHGPIPASHWLLQFVGYGSRHGGDPTPDPQHAWHALNLNICKFLESVPESQKHTVRGEDLLSEPERAFLPILEWLNLRADARALERMKHPEESPYASLGPRGAEFGSDRLFLQSPAFRRNPASPHRLEGAPDWRADGVPLTAPVIELATRFGYS